MVSQWTVTIAPSLQRHSIPSSAHTYIDLSLKELKSLSRGFNSIISPYLNELRILERIYYKGKNQHRSSLFWKKVVEVRRLVKRFNEVNLPGVVEDLRSSFHTPESRINPKLAKGPWTHAPDRDMCKATLKRLRSTCSLIDQTRARFHTAYQSFTVQLRMATFLPLIISLIGITSRFDFLLAEVRRMVPSLWEAVMRVAKVIDPNYSWQRERSIQLPSLPLVHRPSGDEVRGRPRKKLKIAGETDEDLGSKVHRQVELPFNIPTVGLPSTDVYVPGDPITAPWDVQGSEQTMRVEPVRPSTVPLSRSATSLGSTFSAPLTSCPSTPRSNTETVAQHKNESFTDIKKPKRMNTKSIKKRDEIDDIFDFE